VIGQLSGITKINTFEQDTRLGGFHIYIGRLLTLGSCTKADKSHMACRHVVIYIALEKGWKMGDHAERL
jgi:hypothetical protein